MGTNATATETAGTNNDTDETAATEAAATPPGAETSATGPKGTATDSDATEDGKNPSREAARYRRQLREAETRTETLQADIRELQSEVVRLLMANTFTNPADFDQFIGIEKVLGADGKIDKEKLDSEVAATLQERPYLKPQGPRVATRPRPARGTTVPAGHTAPSTEGAAEKYFGATGAGKPKWHQLLDGKNTPRTTGIAENARAGSRKVKLEIRTAEE